MPRTVKDGPPVADHEDLYRAILYPLQWAVDANRPSSAAFDDAVFSVDIASRTTPHETASRFHSVLRLVRFNCGEARSQGFDTRDEIDLNYPENHAHAHVYFLDYDSIFPKDRKKRARRLAMLCVLVDLE
jgi:hypothetical protein